MPIPTDPLLAQQWHLGNPNAALLDLNVRGVWGATEGPQYSGAGQRVVVIDDGFDYNHVDLSIPYQDAIDYDFENNQPNSFGAASDSHGTAVAGIIAADNNGVGAVGVAFDAQLIGFRTAGFITDAWLQDVRDAILFSSSNSGDVVNISQGIANDTNSEFGFGYNAVRFDEIETSIDSAVRFGRDGLGVTIVKSAGNSRGANYDVNSDDWTNDTRQVVVAAVNQNGFVSSYSSYGAALLVSGFGTPGEVLTTDRSGAAGYNGTDYTSGFNGTSAAAPMVSGVVALMYDANEELGWRDVQNILAHSARQVGSEVGAGIAGAERYAWQWNGSNTWNGGGMHFSNDYGYGLVDALAAVRMAETWLLAPGTTTAQTSPNDFTNTVDMLNAATVIPDGNATGLTFSGAAAFADLVERVTISVTFSTTFLADLEIYVTSPDGVVSEIINEQAGSADYNGTWVFESQAFRGERANGTWSVRIVDDQGGDVLTVSDIVLRTWGDITSSDRYVFTNEYSDYDGIAGHLTAISDTNGGSDVVNAAAVTSSSSIRLDGSVGSIDGVAVTFATNIEHAISGDGNDFLRGNGGGNHLHGGRGVDDIYGLGGDDSLFGESGNDNLDGGLGADWLDGGVGEDTIYYSQAAVGVAVDLSGTVKLNTGEAEGDTFHSIENVWGSLSPDLIAGNGGSNKLYGSGGSDDIYGLGGGDFLYGQEGDDNLDGGLGGDLLDGGAGVDIAYYSQASSGVRVDISGALSGLGEALGDTFNLIDGVWGSAFGDQIYGDQFTNRLFGFGGSDDVFGRGGNDFIYGQDGDDNLDGGGGGDLLDGGLGFDFAYYSQAAAGVLADLANSVAGVGEALGDTFSFVDGLVGSQHGDTLFGDQWSNVLNGLGDADYLDGGGLDDSIFGGGGTDTIAFTPGSGWDTVFDFEDNVDQIRLAGWGFSSVAQALSFCSDTGSAVRFDFADGTHLTVYNVANVADLNDDVLIS